MNFNRRNYPPTHGIRVPAEEMKQLVVETDRAWQSLGKITFGPTEVEKKSLIFRRSLYIAKDMKAGDVLTSENMRVVRPGLGLKPKYLAASCTALE